MTVPLAFVFYIQSLKLSVTGPSNHWRPPRGVTRCAARCGEAVATAAAPRQAPCFAGHPARCNDRLLPFPSIIGFRKRRHNGGAHAPLVRLHGADAALRTAAGAKGGAEAGCASPSFPFAPFGAAARGRLRSPPPSRPPPVYCVGRFSFRSAQPTRCGPTPARTRRLRLPCTVRHAPTGFCGAGRLWHASHP